MFVGVGRGLVVRQRWQRPRHSSLTAAVAVAAAAWCFWHGILDCSGLDWCSYGVSSILCRRFLYLSLFSHFPASFCCFLEAEASAAGGGFICRRRGHCCLVQGGVGFIVCLEAAALLFVDRRRLVRLH